MSNDKTIDANQQAVRHLIVCDTQFAWNGSTTLKLQEMMDLQARGWIAEGEDNLEFNLTEAGEEVVARALQNGAPATLATAKHGGCVQLPTSERERFEAWAESSGEGLSRWPDGLYVRQATQVAWDAWQAALSAQPSPGETLPPEMRLGSPDYLDYLDTQPSPGGQGEARRNAAYDAIDRFLRANMDDVAYAVHEEHLETLFVAARLPHGDESCEDTDAELQFYREEVLNLPNILIGAGVFSVDHEGDYKAAWANIIAGIERLAARQPVGEQVDDDAASQAFGEFADDYLTDGNGYAPASTYEACSKAFNAAWPDRAAATAAARAELKRLHGDDRTVGARRAEAMNRSDARDDAEDDAAPPAQQPAQAVDMGQMPEGWHLSKKATCYQLSHGNDIIGNLVGPDAEANAAIIARVLDSKAVGK